MIEFRLKTNTSDAEFSELQGGDASGGVTMETPDNGDTIGTIETPDDGG
jgi:hypothetical protein